MSYNFITFGTWKLREVRGVHKGRRVFCAGGGGERNLRIVEMYKNTGLRGRGAPAQQVAKPE